MKLQMQDCNYTYSEEMLSRAINNILAKKLSMRKASVIYSVSKIFENYSIIFFAQQEILYSLE